MDETFLLSKAKPATWHLIVARLIICFLNCQSKDLRSALDMSSVITNSLNVGKFQQ
jgi:hypothetical protein